MSAPSPAGPGNPAPTPTASLPPTASHGPHGPLMVGREIKMLVLNEQDARDAAASWGQLREWLPPSVRESIPPEKLAKLPETIAKGWTQRCALIDRIPIPNLGPEWLLPSLPLQAWHDQYLSHLRYREWISTPANPSQDWRIKALTVRQVDDLVVPPGSPQHAEVVVTPSPQTWLALTPPVSHEADPQPFLLLSVNPESIKQTEVPRVTHLKSGRTVTLTVGSACFLMDQEEDLHLCRLFQHQGRVFVEGSPTMTP